MTEPTRPGEPHHYPRELADGRDAPARRPTFTPRSGVPRAGSGARCDEPRSGYVGSQWAANLVVQRVANSAAAHGAAGDGYSAYFNSWQLFQLPYAVVGIAVISALLPRMSGHASDRRYSKAGRARGSGAGRPIREGSPSWRDVRATPSLP
jgi:Lipid II flippase MurJ